MNTPTSTEFVCVIDTNTLIGFALWHPFDFFSDFWIKLESALQERKFVLLDVVEEEVKRHNIKLKEWLKKQKDNDLVIKIDDEVREKAVEIDSQYNMINQNSGNSEVDTYIVSYALLNNLGIFTRESPRRRNSELYKIPDVCNKFSIICIKNPDKFLTSIGY